MLKAITKFMKLESTGGVVLFLAAVLALIVDNSALSPWYQDLLSIKFTIGFERFKLSKELILWINDGLMAIFFFLVGLEIKREMISGELNSFAKATLPGIAAIGGMLVPAAIYVAINWQHKAYLNGWAIPTATDIAFALGVLALLGKRVPVSLKVFLTALAIMDDLGAIVIIAIFYTYQLSMFSLGMAGICLAVLFVFNRLGVMRFLPYGIVGVILWVCVLKSGVHATLAGVVLALAYPTTDPKRPGYSPSHHLEEALHPWVAFGVLPIFAFANAGIPLADINLASFIKPVPLGIACGLFFGKQLGIFGASWLSVKCRIASLPQGANWWNLYGVALICGIGFTMSLFIGTLAFAGSEASYANLVRLGVISGSLLSGLLGYFVLLLSAKSPQCR
ncbi:MAG: Na+/H+ antiporter NhaA [Legionellales bacterium]|nr:Na+/H+ antiporter NhaA [Legionellales bacterium]